MIEEELGGTVENGDQWFVNGLKYLVAIAIYCAIGWGIDYWIFVPDGSLSNWAIPSTYLVMIFWPLVLMWQFLKIVMIGVVLVIIVIVLAEMYRKN